MRKENGQFRKTIFWGPFLLVILLVFLFFHGAFAPYQQNERRSEALAEKYAHINRKIAYYEYSRDGKNYNTIKGSTKQGEKLYAIISGNGKKINVIAANSGISANKAQNFVLETRKAKRVLHVALGMQSNGKRPVWEVTYLNQNDQLCYSLLSFKNGSVIQEIQNL